MLRTRLKPAVIVLLGAAALSAWGCRERPRTWDNLVLVTIDTLRADHVGAWGYPRPTTPFIDRLAREGAVFEHAESACSQTAPAHASIFTGLYPFQHGDVANSDTLAQDVPTLAGRLRTQGFLTAAVPSVNFLRRVANGFDVVRTPDSDSADLIRKSFPYRPAADTFSRAADWLRRSPADRRIFLWVHVYDVHSHEKRDPMPQAELKSMREGSKAERRKLARFLVKRQGLPMKRGAERLLARVDRYDAQLLYLDHSLERFFEQAGRRLDPKKTLWVVTADHGEGLGHHGYIGHGKFLYEEQLHVPLLFWSEGASWAGHRIAQLARHVDLLPTLLEMLDVRNDRQETLAGSSLVPLLNGTVKQRPGIQSLALRRRATPHFLHLGWSPGVVLSNRSANYKVIYTEATGAVEGFDLTNDPLETQNIWSDRSPELHVLMDGIRNVLPTARLAVSGSEPELPEKDRHELEALGYL